jgi:hypothetical protein
MLSSHKMPRVAYGFAAMTGGAFFPVLLIDSQAFWQQQAFTAVSRPATWKPDAATPAARPAPAS